MEYTIFNKMYNRFLNQFNQKSQIFWAVFAIVYCVLSYKFLFSKEHLVVNQSHILVNVLMFQFMAGARLYYPEASKNGNVERLILLDVMCIAALLCLGAANVHWAITIFVGICIHALAMTIKPFLGFKFPRRNTVK